MSDPLTPLNILALIAVLGVLRFKYVRRKQRTDERATFIRSYVFAPSMLQSVRARHPPLTDEDLQLVSEALRVFFLVRLHTGETLLGMPSKVVDDLWHEFILHTQDYQRFCQRAFGGFFHHIPAQGAPAGVNIQYGMRATFQQACLEENISLIAPERLPLLFAIDARLSIVDGNRYTTKQLALKHQDIGAGVACGGGGGGGTCGGHSCGGHGGSCGGH
jgi:hypothetical protein